MSAYDPMLPRGRPVQDDGVPGGPVAEYDHGLVFFVVDGVAVVAKKSSFREAPPSSVLATQAIDTVVSVTDDHASVAVIYCRVKKK